MHEVGIAEELVRQVLAAACGMARVTEVAVDVGALQWVDSDALRQAFDAASQGTLAEGARLELREVPPRAVCGACAAVYVPEELGIYVCPACGAAEPEFVEGNDIILVSLECLSPEEENRESY